MRLRSCGALVLGVTLLSAALGAVPDVASASSPDAAVAEAERLDGQARELFRGGRLAEAEQLLVRALALVEAARGPAHLAVAGPLWALAVVHHAGGDLAGAEARLRRVLSIRESALGADHGDTRTALHGLAEVLDAAGRPEEAEPLWREVLARIERALGPSHPAAAYPLLVLARRHGDRQEYREAEPLLIRALAARETALGPGHVEVARVAIDLARALLAQGRPNDAEPLARRALKIRETALGGTHPDVVESLEVLGTVHADQGRYGEAEPLLDRAVSGTEAALGSAHPALATRLTLLGRIQLEQGLLARAETRLERALVIRERAPESGPVLLAQGLHNLAVLRRAQHRYAEATRLSLRALTLVEGATGPDSLETAATLGGLGLLHATVGQHDLAEPLLRRALGIFERRLGPAHPRVAGILNNLAVVDAGRGQRDVAVADLARTVEILERVLGPEHPDLATVLNNLAVVQHARGRKPEAEPALRRALAIQEQALGPGHPEVATTLVNLGDTLLALDRPADAEPLLRRAHAIGQQLAPGDVRRAVVLATLAQAVEPSGRLAEARSLYEQARRDLLAVARAQLDLDDAEQRALLRVSAPGLAAYAALLARLARDPAASHAGGGPAWEAFVVAEQARSGAARAALARAAARVATGDPAAAGLARAAQDLQHRRDAVRRRLAARYGQAPATRDAREMAALAGTIRQLDGEVAGATRRLLETFPAYAEVVAPEPLGPDAARALLRPGEALLSLFALKDRVLVWLLRPEAPPAYHEAVIAREDLVELVTRVRRSVAQEAYPETGRLTAADVAGAHRLYALLVAPLERHLEGAGALLVVPDEVLAAVPFGALVTRAEGPAFEALAARHAEQRPLAPEEVLEHARIAWLARRHAISVLPAATSLRALRQGVPRRGAATEPLIGFGDPVLQGYGRRGSGTIVRGAAGMADPGALRQLAALPGTRDELRTLAAVLGADAGTALFLGPRATETELRDLDAAGRLGAARVVAFATHGLLAGEAGAFSQPALVLTPPAEPSEADDGLLSLEEILGLRLTHTDWVVLSACNTAADDGSGESLAGLARAFFFAGARTLLVSQWSVGDRTTRALMTEVFRRHAAGTGPAEALRQGSLALMGQATPAAPVLAHPYVWAPFSIVGEGR